MFDYFLKILLVSFVSFLGLISPAFAKVSQQIQASAQYFDDLQTQEINNSFKARRDLNTQHLYEQIFQKQPSFRNRQTDLAKAVIKRKIMIAREKEFLNVEFQKGIENLYQNAVVQYTQKYFSASQKDFEEIDRLWANYKETRNYLQMLEVVPLDLSLSRNIQGGRK